MSQGLVQRGSGPRKVATIAAGHENPPAEEKRRKQGRVAELRCQLQEAEVEESMTEVMATMHVLQPGEQESKTFLGPTLTAEVNFEGSRVQALLDT